MKLKESLESVGMPVRDIYGRVIGTLNGYTLANSGELGTIGVESGGNFLELSGRRVVSAKKEVLVLPVWKAEAVESGFEVEVLGAKMKALERMLASEQISQKTHDEMRRGFVAPRQRQEVLLQKISRRLDELQHSDDAIDVFLARYKMQTDEYASSAASYDSIRESCARIKSINDEERSDLTSVQGLIRQHQEPGAAEAPPQHEDELVLSGGQEEARVHEPEATEPHEEAVTETYGTLRSLTA